MESTSTLNPQFANEKFADVIVDTKKVAHVAPVPKSFWTRPDDSVFWPQLMIKIGVCSAWSSAFFFALAFIYLGISSDTVSYTQNINVAVMNLDKGQLGQDFMAYASTLKAGNGMPTFKLISTPTSLDDMTNKVANADWWGAIVVQENAMAKLNAAYANADATYDPTGAFQLIYDETRFPSTVGGVVAGPGRSVLTNFCTNFSSYFIKAMGTGSNPSRLAAVASKAPKLLTQSVSFTEVNLHPVKAQVSGWGLAVGVVLLITFSFLAWVDACVILPPTELDGSYILFAKRIGVTLWLTFLLSFTFMIVFEALWAHFPSSEARVSFWMLNWLHMMHYGCWFAFVTHLFDLGRVLRFWAIVVIVVNATSGFSDPTLAHNFYQWSWAMPALHANTAARNLLGNGRDTYGVNVGAIVVWTFFSFCLAVATAPRIPALRKALY